MPRLRNFCLIKDTTTGKYLVNVGGGGYYGRPRNNGWSENGNFYKATQVLTKLGEAARIVTELRYYADHPDYPRTTAPWSSPEYKAQRDDWLAYYSACRAWVHENAVIPDTWVVVQFSLGPNGETTEVPAKEWKG